MTMQVREIWLLAAAIAVATVGTITWRLKPCFWYRMWSARVESNGTPLKEGRLYRGSPGYVMIYLGDR